LDEIAKAHVAVGGSARGRRFTTQQINQAYAVLLAAHFQGFCRDLHSECVDHILAVMAPPGPVWNYLQAEMARGRQVDRGNAQPSSIGADFGRFGLRFWPDMSTHDLKSLDWRNDLDLLNDWRNAIVHQDFTSPKLGGIINLRLKQVRGWRNSCRRLALAMDKVVGQHIATLTGKSPW
jgi:hypothetical protein